MPTGIPWSATTRLPETAGPELFRPRAGSLPGRVRAEVLSAEMLIRDRCMLSSARLANQVFPGGNYGRRKYMQEPVLLVSAAAGRQVLQCVLRRRGRHNRTRL